MGHDWRRLHAARDGIRRQETADCSEVGLGSRPCFNYDQKQSRAKPIGYRAEKRGGSPMRVGIEINFALWGMIICVVIEALQTFAIL